MSQKEKKSVDQMLGIPPEIQEDLRKKGIDLENLCCGDKEGEPVKVVCISPSLGESVEEMGQTSRGQTLMVRIDEETSKILDSWVETNYVKSRSEAAALFIREGLKVRASELENIKEDLDQVKKAKKKLHEKARKIFEKSKK